MNEMKRNRMIRLVSPATSDAIDNFVNTFDEDMFVKPGAEIALLNATIPVEETDLVVETGVNDTLSISYNGGNTYQTITIPPNTYTLPQLVEQIQFYLPKTVPSTGGYGIEFETKLDGNSRLQIIFYQTQTYVDDGTQTGQVNVIYDKTNKTWSSVVQAGLSANEYYFINYTPFTLGSGFLELDVKGTVSANGSVNLGLGEQDTLLDRFASQGEIDVTDPTEITYAMRLNGSTVFYFHEDGNPIVLSLSAQDNDYLRMEFDNLAGTVKYILRRGTTEVASATENFTESLRYKTYNTQLCPYVGLGNNVNSFASDVRYTPAPDELGNVKFLNKTLVLQFPSERSKEFYGFVGSDFTVQASGADGGTFQATSTPKNNGYIPAIAVELSNLELQTYDGKRQQDGRFGRVRSIVAVIPGIEPQNRSITYEPQEPTYVALNNRDEINLNKLEVRLLTEDDTYMRFIPRACLTLAIRD